MSHADLSAARWQELSGESAAEVARVIARENQLDLVGVRDHAYAGRHHRIAVFERAGMQFCLVPSGLAALGYDGAGFRPSPRQLASYGESAGEYGLPAITEHVDLMTSPQRVVELSAMLVGVEALDACLTPVDPGDPRVQPLAVAGGRPGGRAMRMGQDGGVKVEFDMTGRAGRAWIVKRATLGDAIEQAASLGLRPASPDEWEYACGAGARTLFRWGEDTPGDDYPSARAAGPHQEPNRWGLMIGRDPYRHEWTAEPGIVCGGDGGGVVCGGSGFFLGWLTLATAYRDAQFGARLSRGGFQRELLIRPVIDMS